MSNDWISDRLHNIDASGIRKVFDLAANMDNPINLSIGQPHFDTPQPVKDALCNAVQQGRNAYSQTQGIAPLREKLQATVNQQYSDNNRQLLVTSGTSGALMLVLSTLINPGDEVIVFDPWFVMYKHLTSLAGGKVVQISTYPDFRIDPDKVEAAITKRTKAILFNSPGNPTGSVAGAEETRALAEIAARHNIALISDEIYREFCYDKPFVSPARWNPNTIVIDGFSKSHSMTGLRLGFAHGPEHVIQQMTKLQQFTFVCAPHPVQWAGVEALDTDMQPYVDDYRVRRDLMVSELSQDFEITGGDGAFYLFLKTPWGTGTEFVKECIRQNLLVIPGNVFSPADSHFRVSFAAETETIKAGAEVLRQVAKSGESNENAGRIV